MMVSVALSFALHYLSFMAFLGVLTADLTYMDLPAHHTYAGRLKFLTYWSFLADLVYFNLAAIVDFLMWIRGRDSPLWRRLRDFVFTTIIFPLTTFVCLMFWALFLHNPLHLRNEDEMGLIIPWWIDHGFHTLPVVTVFLQAFLVEHVYPRKRVAFLSLLTMDALYLCWLLWIAHKAKFWVYPLLSHMSFIGIVVFVFVMACISFIFYFIGKKFTDVVWGKTDREKTA